MSSEDISFEEIRRRRTITRSERFGISMNSAMQEIRSYALSFFDQLDTDQDGFLSYDELEKRYRTEDISYRERLCLRYILIHRHDIQQSYQEPGFENSDNDGVSREDISVFFTRVINRNLHSY